MRVFQVHLRGMALGASARMNDPAFVSDRSQRFDRRSRRVAREFGSQGTPGPGIPGLANGDSRQPPHGGRRIAEPFPKQLDGNFGPRRQRKRRRARRGILAVPAADRRTRLARRRQPPPQPPTPLPAPSRGRSLLKPSGRRRSRGTSAFGTARCTISGVPISNAASAATAAPALELPPPARATWLPNTVLPPPASVLAGTSRSAPRP